MLSEAQAKKCDLAIENLASLHIQVDLMCLTQTSAVDKIHWLLSESD